MLQNYLTTAYRAFRRHTGYAFINIIGLATGLACCLLILLFVKEELSFDQFHGNSDRIYRVLREDSAGTAVMNTAVIIGLLAPQLEEKFPAIEQAVRMHQRKAALAYGNRRFDEEGFFWTDADVFKVFDFELLEGNPDQALQRPGTVVITPELARRYFGSSDPIGKTLIHNGARELEVTGVIKRQPENSHLKIEAMASIATFEPMDNPWQGETQGWTYLLLREGAVMTDVASQINASLDVLVSWFVVDNMYIEYNLQPLSRIRLHSDGISGAGPVSDVRYVYLLAAIGFLVLLVASINYMNLTTARSIRRSREVGMRKTLGAGRGQLMGQFVSEAVGTSLVAFLVAAVLIELFLPYFNAWTDHTLAISYTNDLVILGLFLGVTTITGLFSGFYPAVILSGVDPVRSLKGMTGGRSGSRTRKWMVGIQFGISVSLLFCSIIIYNQMQFMRHGNLGFETEQIISINNRGLNVSPDVFRDALAAVPGVVSVSNATGIPMGSGWQSSAEIDGQKSMLMRLLVDEHYIETMGMEMILGRAFSPDNPADRSEAVLVNETLVNMHGWKDPLSEILPMGIDEDGNQLFGHILGVVKEFHTGSFKKEIMPTIFDASPKWDSLRRSFLVRLDSGDVDRTLAALENTWNSYVSDFPFSFSFVDDEVDAMYRSEERLANAFRAFTALAIFIACLGLFGLAAFTAEQRTREIGIRKVCGATVSDIVSTLLLEYFIPVALAMTIAIPLAFLGMSRWLDNFAYRIDIHFGSIILSVVVLMVFAGFTVIYQSARAAMRAPAECLRIE